METLSLKSYASKCVLGMEVAYVICLIGGYLPWRTERAIELHHTLFETLPGFIWGNPLSYLWGAILLGVLAWIGGAYIVWMHNSSLEGK